jgi:excisionase family DNA binding protein
VDIQVRSTQTQMSSLIRIKRTCQFCKKSFIAKTTVTKCCSDYCAKRSYKLRIRNKKIANAKCEDQISRKPEEEFTSIQIKSIQAKRFLNLKEAAFLLNISPLTLRRWVLSGKMKSNKLGKKHIFDRKTLGF